jgi:hypothetical protein
MTLPAISPLSPLGGVLNDIQRSIDAQLHYPALLVALTVPEICAALTLERQDFVKEKHYVKFLEDYADTKKLELSPAACYRLRGGVVHRANMVGHPDVFVTNVILTIPETVHGVHGMLLEYPPYNKTAAMLDLRIFCRTIVDAAERWYEANHRDSRVIENMQGMIRLCPDGLHPFIEGGPVIASGT